MRYHGEPVALVAADHPETARRAMKKIKVDYDVLAPVDATPRRPSRAEAPLAAPRRQHRAHGAHQRGDRGVTADVVVTGVYEVGMQDQAFLGPESGLAVPAEDGGVDLYVATQWLHVDQRQICAAWACRRRRCG